MRILQRPLFVGRKAENPRDFGRNSRNLSGFCIAKQTPAVIAASVVGKIQLFSAMPPKF